MAKKQLPSKGRSRGKGSRYERNVMIGIVVAALAIALTLWGPLRTYRFTDGKKPAQQAEKKQDAVDRDAKKSEKKDKTAGAEKRDARAVKKGDAAGADRRALVAIVIDDLGQDLKAAREVLSLPARVTFSVMPGLPNSRKVAELAKQGNHEVLLHLPMEYRSRNGKPAPGMLRSDMTPMDFLNTLTENLNSVPGAVGVNNHEGSALTENTEAMKFLMAELKARELFFLDSLTSSKSVAYATAKEFGLKAGKRDVFLDNDSDNAESIRKQLDELSHIAKQRGRAVGIGHPHPATVKELRTWIATTAEQGIEIVPLSRLMQ